MGWVPAAASMGVAALALRRTARTPGLQPGAARFWRQIYIVAVLCSLSLTIRAIYIAPLGSAPDAASVLPLPTMVLSDVAVVLGVWALLRVPVGRISRGEWLRLLLDTLTVVLGAGLVIWYANLGPLVEHDDASPSSVWSPFFIATLCLVGLSGVIKIVLVGAGPVDMGALRLIGAGFVVGGLSAGSASLLTDSSHVVPGQTAVPVHRRAAVVAARRQARVVTGRDRIRG